MNVRLRVATRYRGKRYLAGDELDVSDAVAERWQKRGIARAPDLSDLTVAELKSLAEERGVDLTGASRKAEILERLA